MRKIFEEKEKKKMEEIASEHWSYWFVITLGDSKDDSNFYCLSCLLMLQIYMNLLELRSVYYLYKFVYVINILCWMASLTKYLIMPWSMNDCISDDNSQVVKDWKRCLKDVGLMCELNPLFLREITELPIHYQGLQILQLLLEREREPKLM